MRIRKYSVVCVFLSLLYVNGRRSKVRDTENTVYFLCMNRGKNKEVMDGEGLKKYNTGGSSPLKKYILLPYADIEQR